MYHYIRLDYDVPSYLRRFQAIDALESYIYGHLDEFGCLPRDDNVNKVIYGKYGPDEEYTNIHLMIRMSDEEAIKTAGDRSEFKHAAPSKIDKVEKKALRKMSKRKRSESTDENAKKLKRCDCLICLDDLSTHKITTLVCDHTFHYRCISKWMSIRKTCPVCSTIVDI